MKSRFPWNMALHCYSRVFFESSQWAFQVSRPVYPLLRMWQQALDEQFTLPLAIIEIIAQDPPTSPNSICPRNDDSNRSIRLINHVVLVFKDLHGLIWPIIVIMQRWFTLLNLLIHDGPYLALPRSWEGYASLRLWFHAFEIRLQSSISSITFTTIMIYRQNLE